MSRIPDYEYPNLKRVLYGDAQFIPVCRECGRYVKADDEITVSGDGFVMSFENATCSRCGRVCMLFEGHVDIEDDL